MGIFNLEKKMTGKIIKGNLNGEKIAEQWINVNNAILIAKQYAEELSKKQREICADEYHNIETIECLDSKIYNIIRDAPLATEKLPGFNEVLGIFKDEK